MHQITPLRSLKEYSYIYQVFVPMLVKKHLHFYHSGASTQAGFCRVTCKQAEMLNMQFQDSTIFADKK